MDRETLEAFYVRGHSLLEMSDEFDAPVGTIKRRLHVARKRLAQEMGETERDEALAQGTQMTLDDAVTFALGADSN